MGLGIKVENIAFAPHEVVFCRSKIVETINGPTMVKIPLDAFKTQTCIVRHFKGSQLPDYLSTLRDGFSNLWAGVPVMHKLGHMFPEGRVNKKLLSGTGIERWMHTSHGTRHEITMAARASFERTFGISPEVQIALEEKFVAIGKEVAAALPLFDPKSTPTMLPVR